ncbi:protein phosphatase 1 regulatory subunit 12B isoform X2 [Copidosoma floridanum]|uniref:protein phosphatase 1 regulatory subunit 12B isoform X2 n=1 Tax=Copidosoma floridanum TaxID=29053 RepID=UPI0006C95221|nr:protein phosphatase 1 regulatory subunit 12B isoform X2 [Copidosoma floridanum]
MSLENRSSSALFKRAEQLKRWEQSETNKEPPDPQKISRKIKFSADCVFLAACSAGDKDEVVRLLQKGADINTGNVDGLTALHQACIDDDLDMVEFLVEQGADINRGDNEGWTPLHATASCGFISIAKYLIEQGCNLAAVNNDGELALDIAESDEMEELLQDHINKAGIDCDKARSEEERLMLSDARAWKSGAPGKDTVHPRSGATALHVAAAKGYTTVMNILLQARCDVNARDNDGWTPLHGAAHWGQIESCKLLVDNYCDMDIKNYAGQTAFDVADPDIVKALEELKKKQEVLLKEHPQIINKPIAVPKKRVSTNENLVIDQKGIDTFEEETPNKVKKVELEIQSDKEESSVGTNSDVEEGVDTDVEEASEGESESETSSDTQSSTCSEQSNKSNRSNNSTCLTDDEKKNRANREETASYSPQPSPEVNKVPNQAPVVPPKQQSENNDEGSIPSWRRSGSFRNRGHEMESTNSISTRIEEREKPLIKTPTSPIKAQEEPEVVLRRTHSFETDEKKKDIKLNLELSPVLQTNSTQQSPTGGVPNKSLPTTPVTGLNSSSPLPANQIRSLSSSVQVSPTTLSATNNSMTVPATPTTPGGSKLSPGNIFKNFFKSFVPPVRDEESETQRKAHAKRVRETRRSTQGVTLDEIKSAEQLVKKKQQQSNDVGVTSTTVPAPTTTTTAQSSSATTTTTATLSSATTTTTATASTTTASITATITTAVPTTTPSSHKPTSSEVESTSGGGSNLPERRPSWRLKVDGGSKFQLEDANNRNNNSINSINSSNSNNNNNNNNNNVAVASDTTTAYIRRPTGNNAPNAPRPSSAPVDGVATVPTTTTTEATVTLPLRRPVKPPEDKEQDKENDSRNAQATQAVIQRRRRPKRRSTGVVHVDMDEIDPEKQDTPTSGETDADTKVNHNESGHERSGRSSRLGSASSLSSESGASSTRAKAAASENGELDYKKLYEESQVENERLRERLRKSDEQLRETQTMLDKAQNKSAMSETEKRERRAMERKLSEMEEELKIMETLKCENQRLKDENGALIRVISKLSK